MKVLLDENLPHNLIGPLSHHEVRTIDDLGWKGIKNGELLKRIAAEQFDVFLTGDKNLLKQQNMTGRRVALVIMSAINWPIIKEYVPVIVAAIETSKPGSVNSVQCGAFFPRPRRKPFRHPL